MEEFRREVLLLPFLFSWTSPCNASVNTQIIFRIFTLQLRFVLNFCHWPFEAPYDMLSEDSIFETKSYISVYYHCVPMSHFVLTLAIFDL